MASKIYEEKKRYILLFFSCEEMQLCHFSDTVDKENICCKTDLKMASWLKHRKGKEKNENNIKEPEKQHEDERIWSDQLQEKKSGDRQARAPNN